MTPEDVGKFNDILLPYLAAEKKEFDDNCSLLVHYTSSDNANKIITNKCLWMRNVSLMNDYAEVLHGYNMLRDFFLERRADKSSAGVLQLGLSHFVQGIVDTALAEFDLAWSDHLQNTYISSLSVRRPKENHFGKLSMWRAYGGNNGASAALILNNPPPQNNGLNIFLCPALYWEKRRFEEELVAIFQRLEKEKVFLMTLEKSDICNQINMALIILIVSLKHVGFQEENEWRIIYFPSLLPSHQAISESVESINGVPEIIYKLPLDKDIVPELGIEKIFHGMILGPSKYPVTQKKAFMKSLELAGVSDAENKIWESGIPLRT